MAQPHTVTSLDPKPSDESLLPLPQRNLGSERVSGMGSERGSNGNSTSLLQPSDGSSREDFEKRCRESAEFLLPLEPLLLQAALAVLDAVTTKRKGARTRKRAALKSESKGWVSGTGYGGSNNDRAQTTMEKHIAKAREQESQIDLCTITALQELVAQLEIVSNERKDDELLCGLGGLFCLSYANLMQISLDSVNKNTKRGVKRKRAKLPAHANPQTTILAALITYWRNDSLMDVGERLDLYSTLLEVFKSFTSMPPGTGLPGLLFLEAQTQDESNGSDTKEGVPQNEDVNAKQGSDVQSTSLADRRMRHHIFAYAKLLCKQGESISLAPDAFSAISDPLIHLPEVADFEYARLDVFFKSLRLAVKNAEAFAKASKLYQAELQLLGPIKRSERRDLLRMSAAGLDLEGDKLQQGYINAIKGLQFRSVALLDVAAIDASKVSYAYHEMATNPFMSFSRARMARISKEMSTMTTSLPLSWGSSVCIRADESRPDVMSCLILGPENTPYANGAFVFDIFLPFQYPSVPPKVILKTTGHGTVRFNPNLYVNGKVCLSLLGTWSGPGWDAKKSTLLQVLVSIQSLIMVDEPFFNEPGYETSMGTPKGRANSNAYNEEIRLATMRWALLDYIQKPPYLFADVLKLHFSLKAKEIKATLDKWVEKASPERKGEYVSLSASVSEALDNLRDSTVNKRLAFSTSITAPVSLDDEDSGKTDLSGVTIVLDSDDETSMQVDPVARPRGLAPIPVPVPAPAPKQTSVDEPVDLTL